MIQKTKKKRNKRLFLAENIFFKFLKSKFYLWNCDTRSQYELTDKDFDIIKKVNSRKPLDCAEKKLAQEMIEEGIFLEKEPDPLEWGWDILSRLYHFGTMDVVPDEIVDKETYARDYLRYSHENLSTFKYSPLHSKPLILLPSPTASVLDEVKFLDILKRRKTIRNFKHYKFNLEEFSTLLYYGFGFQHDTSKELNDLSILEHSKRKLFASAGNIHPEELFIYIYNVDTLAEGFYYYNVESHGLVKINDKKITYSNLSVLLNNQVFGENSSFCFFLCSRFEKVWWKYKHSRSYRFVNFEIGEISHNIQLVTAGLKKSFWLTGEFSDKKISSLLGLNETTFCLFIMTIGNGDSNAIPKSFVDFKHRI